MYLTQGQPVQAMIDIASFWPSSRRSWLAHGDFNRLFPIAINLQPFRLRAALGWLGLAGFGGRFCSFAHSFKCSLAVVSLTKNPPIRKPKSAFSSLGHVLSLKSIANSTCDGVTLNPCARILATMPSIHFCLYRLSCFRSIHVAYSLTIIFKIDHTLFSVMGC